MSQYFLHLKVLLKKLLLAFIVFTICRLLFLIFYSNHFDDVSFSIFLYGLRFDLVSISFLFSPVVLFHLLPFRFRNLKWYNKTIKILYFLALFIGISLNMLDLGYFEYTLKRSTADLFDLVSEGDDFFTLLPHYIIDFWYAYILLAILFYASLYSHKKWIKQDLKVYLNSKKDYLVHSSIFIACTCLLIIGMRGGLQYKPINIVNAAQYTSTQNIPLLLNTPFTIMKTLSKESLESPKYFSESEVSRIYSPEQYIEGNGKYANKNIVIIILESFSKEYIGYLNNGKGYTPFLDSLMNYSYVYTNAYANGQRSMESLPSILAGLPQLMNTPYISSIYSRNELDALPKLLKKQGYNTSFYHGGANGTMGFNGFTKMIGIDKYYGMNEYPKKLKEKNYDGLWGIFDEPYLQYFAEELSNKKEPFFSTIFTLSSHHPYTIPEIHKGKFPRGNLAIHESVGYTDYSLKQFFNSIKNKDWFKNTIFVFTADHASISESKYYKTKLNRLAIPTFIYDNSESKNFNDSTLFQHIDIPVTILKKTKLNDSIITFGNNTKNTKYKYVINFTSNNYSITFNDYFLIFDGYNSTSFFNYKKDPMLSQNLISKISDKELLIKNKMENKLKATIQQYNNRMIENRLSKQ